MIEYVNLAEEERIMMDRIQRAQDRIEGELAAAWDDGELAGLTKGRTEGLTEGRTEGLTEGRTEVARNLLQKGMPAEFITEVTSLTEAEMKTLVQ